MVRVAGTMRNARLPFLVAALVATVALGSDESELISSAQATISGRHEVDVDGHVERPRSRRGHPLGDRGYLDRFRAPRERSMCPCRRC